jgi:very-short-patch-repair endonuclease
MNCGQSSNAEIEDWKWGLDSLTVLFNIQALRERRRQLRRNMTPSEKILWNKLRNKQILNLRFLRQYGIGSYVLDFYCPKLRLAVEVDGPNHLVKSQIEYDKVRQETIENVSVTFLRFTNNMVLENIKQVVKEIKNKCVELTEKELYQMEHSTCRNS